MCLISFPMRSRWRYYRNSIWSRLICKTWSRNNTINTSSATCTWQARYQSPFRTGTTPLPKTTPVAIRATIYWMRRTRTCWPSSWWLSTCSSTSSAKAAPVTWWVPMPTREAPCSRWTPTVSPTTNLKCQHKTWSLWRSSTRRTIVSLE